MPYEHVQPTGRRMTRQLAAAIDDCTGIERMAVIRAFSEMENTSSALQVLYRAMALELRLAQLREDQALRELEDPPAGQLGIPGHVPEPPPLTGIDAVFDPADL